ncbi:AbrB family transcriptional regulator [Pseudomonas syringae pv. syringae]|nr:AbrB family transcriptional regulator [Pseudomonas syringae pv. syringae]
MSESLKKTVICQDPVDGSGDLIIDLPQDVIEDMKVAPGDLLSIELVDGMLLLSALRDADTKT